MKIVLWELRSASEMLARCTHQHAPPSGHLLSVHVDESERFMEHLPTEADAHDEAAYLLDDYVARGWTTVIYRDARLNQGSETAHT